MCSSRRGGEDDGSSANPGFPQLGVKLDHCSGKPRGADNVGASVRYNVGSQAARSQLLLDLDKTFAFSPVAAPVNLRAQELIQKQVAV